MALLAKAELRLTRGLTSITWYSLLATPFWSGAHFSATMGCGVRANCMLQPPSIFNALMILRLADLSVWYSLSLRVWLGATTILSPVCIPIGSMFSMMQTAMQLSAASRMTSNSISFQPRTHCSTRTSWLMLESRPLATTCSSSFLVWTMPPPVPPSV